jgi:hypothetical protein
MTAVELHVPICELNLAPALDHRDEKRPVSAVEALRREGDPDGTNPEAIATQISTGLIDQLASPSYAVDLVLAIHIHVGSKRARSRKPHQCEEAVTGTFW